MTNDKNWKMFSNCILTTRLQHQEQFIFSGSFIKKKILLMNKSIYVLFCAWINSFFCASNILVIYYSQHLVKMDWSKRCLAMAAVSGVGGGVLSILECSLARPGHREERGRESGPWSKVRTLTGPRSHITTQGQCQGHFRYLCIYLTNLNISEAHFCTRKLDDWA